MNPAVPIRGVDYIAQVVAVGGADNYVMAQVDIPELFASANPDDLPWATYLLPVGARFNEGDFSPARTGDWVWVDFPFMSHSEIDTRRPRIKGAIHFAPDEVPVMPHDVFGGEEKYEHKRTDDQPAPERKEVNEARVYVIGELMVEMERDGTFRVTNRKEASSWEITKDGAMVSHAEDAQYISSGDETLIESKGDIKIVVGENTGKGEAGNKTSITSEYIFLGSESEGDLEPVVLGDMLAAFFKSFKALYENHIHIGNLGAPTSNVLAAVGPSDFTVVLKDGGAYSKKNRSH